MTNCKLDGADTYSTLVKLALPSIFCPQGRKTSIVTYYEASQSNRDNPLRISQY